MERCKKTSRVAGGLLLSICIVAGTGGAAFADGHGIAMYGQPALQPDFDGLPYADPDAPKGGRIITGEAGTFDSLNPFILKGSTPWQLRYLTVESLMGRSWDEPFTLYGLLAESIETADDRSWVEFTLNPAARFSDGSPVTVEDVMWSYEILGTEGHPRYRSLWDQIENMTSPRDGVIRFEFAPDESGAVNPELALLAALRPVLKKAQWDGKDFAESGLEAPIASAPYVVSDVDPGRRVVLRRNPDYWGQDVPFMRGQANIDEIRLEFFGDGAVMFEAFKAGEIDTFREFNAGKWASQYDFPAVQRGDVVLEEVAHSRPSGITGFAFNTRRAPFDDIRVRDALIHAFNFEFINEALNDGSAPRITSYYSNSPLAMTDGPAEGRVKELLEPFAAELPPEAMEGYALPVSDGSARNRTNIARATELLAEAGYEIGDGGTMRGPDGSPLAFEILLKQGATEYQQVIDIYVESLRRLGIEPTVTVVDDAQYTQRVESYDFDMTDWRVGVSLSPGNEQKLYWGSDGVTENGTRNYPGIDSPAAEAMIDAILGSESQDDFVAAVQALDRVLTTGRYAIPIWEYNISRVAYYDHLHHPEKIPLYGDWIGWQPDVWWSDPVTD